MKYFSWCVISVLCVVRGGESGLIGFFDQVLTGSTTTNKPVDNFSNNFGGILGGIDKAGENLRKEAEKNVPKTFGGIVGGIESAREKIRMEAEKRVGLVLNRTTNTNINKEVSKTFTTEQEEQPSTKTTLLPTTTESTEDQEFYKLLSEVFNESNQTNADSVKDNDYDEINTPINDNNYDSNLEPVTTTETDDSNESIGDVESVIPSAPLLNCSEGNQRDGNGKCRKVA